MLCVLKLDHSCFRHFIFLFVGSISATNIHILLTFYFLFVSMLLSILIKFGVLFQHTHTSHTDHFRRFIHVSSYHVFIIENFNVYSFIKYIIGSISLASFHLRIHLCRSEYSIIFVFFKVSFVRLIFMYMCTHLSGIACGGQKRVLDSLLNMEVMN
jgi:hypothetical protein